MDIQDLALETLKLGDNYAIQELFNACRSRREKVWIDLLTRRSPNTSTTWIKRMAARLARKLEDNGFLNHLTVYLQEEIENIEPSYAVAKKLADKRKRYVSMFLASEVIVDPVVLLQFSKTGLITGTPDEVMDAALHLLRKQSSKVFISQVIPFTLHQDETCGSNFASVILQLPHGNSSFRCSKHSFTKLYSTSCSVFNFQFCYIF